MALPRGIRNNNPLNIRKGNNWQGERYPQVDKSFEEFTSIEFGLRAGFKLLRNYMRGTAANPKPCDTIEKIISRWAPPSENATLNYIDFVSKQAGVDPRERIYFSDRKKMVDIVRAMCHVECGVQLDRELIESAYNLV